MLVYIHGGGFLAGSPASPWYDGAAFNRDGVVTVSVSYRLGFDGFGWIEDAPNNRAILDWLLALEWVRDNIAHFGGDPERVTIAGQSAGGGAVLSLLAVPRAEGLFHAAISLSGVVVDTPLDEAEAMGRRLASLGGVAPTRAGFAGLDEATILDLQAKVAEPAPEPDGDEEPLGPLVAFASGRALNWGPVVDGDVYPAPLEEAYRSGASAGIPLVLGATDQEFSMALADQHDALAAVPASVILARTGRSPETVEAYLEGRQGDTADVIGQYITDMTFRTVALRLARARQAAPDLALPVRVGRRPHRDRRATAWTYRSSSTASAPSASITWRARTLRRPWPMTSTEQPCASSHPGIRAGTGSTARPLRPGCSTPRRTPRRTPTRMSIRFSRARRADGPGLGRPGHVRKPLFTVGGW